MLTLGGLNGNRVRFWEPLKHAATTVKKADPVVPFLLDPLTLMAYSLLSLTSLEYLEWGSPCIDQDFNVMK
jgi:protease II